MPARMHDDETGVDEELVRALLGAQMRQLADLPVTRVEPRGTDNATWRLGGLEGNCLVTDGRLSGLVDWGLACAGDAAVDVQVVWSPLFDDASRRVFCDALEVDRATFARSRGAAINQACMALPYYLDTSPLIVERSWHKLAALGVPPRTG